MPSSNSTIFLVERDQEIRERLSNTLQEAGYKVYTEVSTETILQSIHNDPPNCIVMEYELENRTTASVLDSMKNDNLYGHLPVIIIVPKQVLDKLDWDQVRADDYVVRPVDIAEALSRICLCMARSKRDVNSNPLTGLPGNMTIMREAEYRITSKENFAMAYLDLDNFKSFNDRYGFNRGDEVLRMTSRVIVNAVRSLNNPNTYVGHIGGDDFIFITPPDLMETACKEVVQGFDLIVPNFYDPEERAKGQIESADRKGNRQIFPLMTVSIAVVDTSNGRINHLADISTRTAEMKKLVKSLPGSQYLIDRRKSED